MAAEFLLDFEPVALARQLVNYSPPRVLRMKKLPSVSIFLLFVLQLALPALKATSVALGSTSWLKATCFLWGPWLLIAVISALGLVLRWALGSEPRPAD